MIPFNKLIEILKYKCQENGIECIEQEESYTSKASFLDNDYIPVYGEENDKYEFSAKKSKNFSDTILSYCIKTWNIKHLIWLPVTET